MAWAVVGLYALLAADPGTDFISLLSRASGPVILAVLVFGAIKNQPWWVPGTTHREVVKQRDELLALALKSTQTTERVVTLAEERAPP